VSADVESLDPRDEEVRSVVAAAAAAVPVDVDAEWSRLVARLAAERRRAMAARGAAAAAVVLLLTVGRPVVDVAGTALVRFVTDVFTTTIDGAADAVDDRVAAWSGRDKAHGTIDDDNEYWVEVRKVHEQLNRAVGWSRWDADELDGAAERLEAIASKDPELEDDVRRAADLIRQAQSRARREPASRAHSIIEGIESELRRRG
jgi:hypothetical protein